MCIEPHQTGFVGKGSDHLQLIKFWLSRTPRKGVCSGAKNFDSALLQPACSVYVSSILLDFDETGCFVGDDDDDSCICRLFGHWVTLLATVRNAEITLLTKEY